MTRPTPPGSLATEAGLLLDVLAQRLTALQSARPEDARTGHDPAGHDPADHDPDRHPATGAAPGGPACTTGCPFCQVLAVVRGERPETAARLVDGALTVVRGLRSLLDHGDHGDHGGGDSTTASPAPSSGTGPPGPAATDGPAGGVRHRTTDQAASTGTGTAPQARVEWIDIR